MITTWDLPLAELHLISIGTVERIWSGTAPAVPNPRGAIFRAGNAALRSPNLPLIAA
jgi:hypothetical protein